MQYFSSNPSNIARVSALILSVYYTFFYSIFRSVISKPQIFLKKTAFHIIQAPFQKHNPRIAYDGTSSNSAYKHTALYRAFSLSWHWSSQRPRHQCCTPNDNTARSNTCSVSRLKKKNCVTDILVFCTAQENTTICEVPGNTESVELQQSINGTSVLLLRM